MKHTFRKCLSIVLALATLLSVCVVPLVAATPKCNHKNYDYTVIGYQAPTCTEPGGTLVACSNPNCDEKRYVLPESWEDALGHDWEEIEGSRKPATITDPGEYKEKCTVCGVERTVTLDPTKCEGGCDPENLEVTNTATCTEDGVKTTTCKVCGLATTEKAPALGHAWDKGTIVVEPVCGVTDDPATPEDETRAPVHAQIEFVCATCGEEKLETEIAPVNHKWQWFDAKDVSCGVAGNTAGYKCVHCGEVDGYSVLPAPQHNYVDLKDADHVWVEATCTDGVMYEKCTICDDVKKTVLKADEVGYHSVGTAASKLNKVSDHTCQLPGFYRCSECNELIADKADPAAHTWGADVAPTCTTYGYHTCKVCGFTEGYLNANGVVIERFNKLGHKLPDDEKAIKNHAATCGSKSWREYDCLNANCPGEDKDGKTPTRGHVTEYTDEEALPHLWQTIPGTPATCTTPGQEDGRKCTRDGCGLVDPNFGATINALGHDWKNVVVEANCQFAQHKGWVCSRCGIEDTNDPVNHPMTEWTGAKDESKHVWNEESGKLETAPTCEKPGTMRYYCLYCNEPSDVEIEALGHDWTATPVGTVPATHTAAGYDVYACNRCHMTDNRNQVALSDSMRDQYESHYASITFTYTDVDGDGDWTFALVYGGHDADNRTGRLVGDYDATTDLGSCGVKSFYEWTCQTCAHNYHQRIEDQYGLTGEHAPIDGDTNMDCTTGTEGTDGRLVCERCTTELNPGTKVPVWHTLDKESTVVVYQGAKAADCLNGGWAEKGFCTKCGAEKVNGATAALDHKVEGKYSFAPVAAQTADCDDAGWDAHYACTLCNKAVLLNGTFTVTDGVLDVTTIEAADIVADIVAAGTTNNYVAPLGHLHNVDLTLVPFGCLKDGYTIDVCAREGCYGEIEIKLYTYGFANHRYDDLTNCTDMDECEGEWCECQNQVQIAADGTLASASNAALIDCGNVWVITEAEPHTNKAGEPIKGIEDCAEWVATQDHKCQYCDKDFVRDEIDHGKNMITDGHHYADCRDNKDYDHVSCTVCKQMWIENVVESNKTIDELHDYSQTLPGSYVAPTWTTLGSEKKICAVCGKVGDTETLKAADIYFSMDVKNKLNAGAVLVNGGMVAVTIKMQAPATDIYSVSMDVKFDNTVMEFAGYEVPANNVFGSAEFVSAYSDNALMDTVKIYAYAENTANKEVHNVEVKDNVLVTLYFEINPDFYNYTTVPTVKEQTSLDFGDVKVLTYDETAFEDENYVKGDEFVALNDVKVSTQTYANLDNLTTNNGAYVLDVYKLGDLNGDAIVAAEDAARLHELALAFAKGSTEYDAQADLNKDGKNDVADFILIKKLMVGSMSYDAVAEYVLAR